MFKSPSWLAALSVVVIAFGGSSDTVASARDQAPPSPSLAAALVLITGTDRDGHVRVGSGFIVESSGTIVTTHTTIADLVKGTVRLSNGDIHDITHVRTYDALKNIAVVQVNGFALPVVQLGNSDKVATSEKLTTLTIPLGAPSAVVSSAVDAVRRLDEGFRVFDFADKMDSANAGAPVFDAVGAVVALLATRTANSPGGPVDVVGIPINYVRGLLQVDDHLSLRDVTSNDVAPTTARTGNVPSTSDNPTVPAAAVPTGANGTVVFYRIRRFVGSALEPSVYCNDQQLAEMDNGRYFKATLEAGSYVCRSTDSTVVTFDLVAGETRYMRVDILTGFMKGHGTIGEVSPRQGAIEIQKLKPLDADHVKTPAALSSEVK